MLIIECQVTFAPACIVCPSCHCKPVLYVAFLCSQFFVDWAEMMQKVKLTWRVILNQAVELRSFSGCQKSRNF